MPPVRTMGRRPTVGELFEYYGRHDICDVIHFQSTRWRILLGFGSSVLLEAGSVGETRRILHEHLRRFVGPASDGERLVRYPTMHVLRDRGPDFDVRYDITTEDDPPTWSAAFRKMALALDVLDHHDVYYQIKFSGHRSLHLRIPAESLPATLEGGLLASRFEAVEKRIKAYLPDTGHSTVGLRAVYSIHPIGGLVSLPLRRDELSSFRPWMANLHTVSVDKDWFDIPADAVERNERFLHEMVKGFEKNVYYPPPTIVPAPVRAYAGEPSWMAEAEIAAGLASSDPPIRVAAARAAMTQRHPLEDGTLDQLLGNDDPDAAWFGLEIALDGHRPVNVARIGDLLSRKDDLLVGSGSALLSRVPDGLSVISRILTDQEEVTPRAAALVGVLAEWDWNRLADLPERIPADSPEDWFRRAFTLCGSSLALRWGLDPERILSTAERHLSSFDTPAAWIDEKRGLFEHLRRLRNRQPCRRIALDEMEHAAVALREAGHDVRGIVVSMTGSPDPFTAQGAILFLSLLWWEDCIDRLIGELGSSSSRRKAAKIAIRRIGSPAIDPLIAMIRTGRDIRFLKVALNLLAELGGEASRSVVRDHLSHPSGDVREAAARILSVYFGMTNLSVRPSARSDTGFDAEEMEEPGP